MKFSGGFKNKNKINFAILKWSELEPYYVKQNGGGGFSNVLGIWIMDYKVFPVFNRLFAKICQ